MEFIWMIVVGLLAGALAKFLMPGDDPGGIFITIAIGIAGSLIAGWLGRALFGWYGPNEAGPGILASIAGAMILLFAYRTISGRRHAHPT
jgi:uncharacterized membrane protein YeaQ/YmgE (transglycosylase-associated protein family)